MNSRGQGFGFLRILFVGGFFLLMFALALAPMVTSALGGFDFSDWGVFDSFVVSHLALWFFGCFVLAILVALVVGLVSSE